MTEIRPLYIDAPGRRLFAMYFPPGGPDIHGAVLHLPPFAEELNRARRMASLAARNFAAGGHGVLLLDPLGCGDSDGDFGDATWGGWCDDARRARDWLIAEVGAPVTLWGVRLGAMMAAALAAERQHAEDRLLLWSPITSGKTMLTQFLRIRVAAAMASNDASVTVAGLRDLLAGGRSVEIAGYKLTPDLAREIDALELAELVPPPGTRVDWIEILSDAARPASPASARVADAWREGDVDVSLRVVAGEPFWSTPEITVVPRLLEDGLRAGAVSA